MADGDQSMELVDTYSTDEPHDIPSTSEPSTRTLTNTVSVGVMHVSTDGVPYWVPDVPDAIKPVIGMSFDSIDVAFAFYTQYARQAGFPSKKSGNNRNKAKMVSRMYFLCSKHGSPPPKTPFDSLTDSGKKQRKTSSQKCGYNAKLIISYNKVTNKYRIEEFVEEHNHDLVHKKDKHFLTSNRRLSYPQKQVLHNLSTINIGPNRAYKILKQTCGGFDQVGATKVDCKNFKRDVNKYIGEYDAQMLVDKLETRKQVFPDFSFEYRQGGEDELNCLFWADGESKRNYIAFGDVVGFDATFRTNTYYMVFVPFTGIDNHNRCVTFGAGLLSHESVEAFTWLLEAFKKHLGPEPVFFVTNQCPAVKQAMHTVFPSTKHRFCMWHITDKFTSKLGSHLCKSGFLGELNNIIWSKTILAEQFENRWAAIIGEYHMQEHKWLSEIYAIRHQWIPAFFRDDPLAALMQTTSRCEGENHFFHQLTNDDLHLIELLQHYDIAMQCQRNEQYKNDHDSRFKDPILKTGISIDEEAGQMFTRYAFFEIQREILKSMVNVGSDSTEEENGVKTYIIRDVDDDIKFCSRQKVVFNKLELTIACSCNLFELEGFLCRHCFFVLRMARVKDFPKKYIMRRWHKDVVPPPHNSYSLKSRELGDNKEVIQTIIRESYFFIDSAIDRLVNDVDKLSLFRDQQKKLMEQVFAETPLLPQMKNKQVIQSLMGVSQPEDVTVKNPHVSRNKGCGSTKKGRIESAKEKVIANANKQVRTCQYCGVVGHYRSTCKQKAEDDAAKRNKPASDDP